MEQSHTLLIFITCKIVFFLCFKNEINTKEDSRILVIYVYLLNVTFMKSYISLIR